MSVRVPRPRATMSPLNLPPSRRRETGDSPRATTEKTLQFRHGIAEMMQVYLYLEDVGVTFKELEAMRATVTSTLLLDVVGLMIEERDCGNGEKG
jgi:hypothetical protein